MDEKRQAAGQKLLEAAQEFWDACHQEGQYGAVQWLESTAGELLIYTRGEYRHQLMSNIHTLPNVAKIHLFGEQMPTDDDDAQREMWVTMDSFTSLLIPIKPE